MLDKLKTYEKIIDRLRKENVLLRKIVNVSDQLLLDDYPRYKFLRDQLAEHDKQYEEK